MGFDDDGGVLPVWQNRITYVTTGRGSHRMGNLLIAERLLGVPIECPRCHTEGRATIWRRFDYFGPAMPLYFTKCRRCRRRATIRREDAIGLAQRAGVISPELFEAAKEAPPDHAPASRDPQESVRKAEEVLANRQRAFGKKHPSTLAARGQLAAAIGRPGDAAAAVRAYEDLLSEQQRALGADRPSTLATRYNLAAWTAKAGRRAEATQSFAGLLEDQDRVLGPDHPYTLATQVSLGQLAVSAGNRDRGLSLLRAAYAGQQRVLGSEHPKTKSTRDLITKIDGPGRPAPDAMDVAELTETDHDPTSA